MLESEDQPKPQCDELSRLNSELAGLVKRSLEQRAAAEALGARIKEVAEKISKIVLTPPPPR